MNITELNKKLDDLKCDVEEIEAAIKALEKAEKIEDGLFFPADDDYYAVLSYTATYSCYERRVSDDDDDGDCYSRTFVAYKGWEEAKNYMDRNSLSWYNFQVKCSIELDGEFEINTIGAIGKDDIVFTIAMHDGGIHCVSQRKRYVTPTSIIFSSKEICEKVITLAHKQIKKGNLRL